MSGLSKWLLAFSAIAFAVCLAPLHAQGLPDVERIEAEGLKLIILGKDGKRTGVLSGRTASKTKDGLVSIVGAELSIKSADDEFKLEAPSFSYLPSTNEIIYSKGMTVHLPDSGEINVPPGKGTLLIEPDVVLHLESQARMEFRSGPEDAPTMRASVPEPVFDMTIERGPDGQKSKSMLLQSKLGGEVEFNIGRMPITGDTPETGPDKPVRIKVVCFGPMKLRVSGEDQLTSLHMQRRVSMTANNEKESLTIQSTSLDVEAKTSEGSDATSLPQGISMKASGNVLIEGQRINGLANEMTYNESMLENQDTRILTLDGQPRLTITDDPEAAPVGTKRLELTAQDSITMKTPVTATKPDQMELELQNQGRIQRFVGTNQQWQLYGKRIEIAAWREPSNFESVRDPSYRFDVEASGYAPLIRVQPVEEDDAAKHLSRATIYGATANGEVNDGLGQFHVRGLKILVLAQLQQGLAAQFRTNIGLDANKETPADKSQLTVRSNEAVSLNIRLGEDTPENSKTSEFSIQAIGNVELDHQPMQRDDSQLVTMTGQDVALRVSGRQLKSAHIHGGDARISVGYDLLSCEQLDVFEADGMQKSKVVGPGTLTLRQTTTLANLRNMLALLPRQTLGSTREQSPDAGWIDFDGTISIETKEGYHLLNMLKPRAYLVFGEFEPPRAGRAGFTDLLELKDPEVQTLFTARGNLLRVESRDVGGRAINVVSLVGNPELDSKLDGFIARASDSIVISGTEVDGEEEVPFTVQIKVDAELMISNASEFLGEYVEEGAFAYDKSWQMTAHDYLEITTRPLDGQWLSAAPTETTVGFGDVRAALVAATKTGTPESMKRGVIEAEQLLKRATGERDAVTGLPPLEVAQPREALRDFRRVYYTLHRAQLESAGSSKREALLKLARAQVRRIRARLGSLIDVSGSGGVDCFFYSSSDSVPPMSISMTAFSITFSGAGDLVGTELEGPVVVRREGYTLRADEVDGQIDGFLVLKGAALDLPKESQIEVEGMERISILRKESRGEQASGNRRIRRTIVTRVTGKKLKVKIVLQGENAGESSKE
ncbi:hypothetical protein OAU50_07905 [Planctomycetota bacterium]|nr:hypothetical protein [Planctomycetota bacterium]